MIYYCRGFYWHIWCLGTKPEDLSQILFQASNRGPIQPPSYLETRELEARKCNITCRFQDSNGNFCSLIVLIVLFHFDFCTGWHKTPNPPETVGSGKKELKCTTSVKHCCEWEESCFKVTSSLFVLFSLDSLPSFSVAFLWLGEREVTLQHLYLRPSMISIFIFVLFFHQQCQLRTRQLKFLQGKQQVSGFPEIIPLFTIGLPLDNPLWLTASPSPCVTSRFNSPSLPLSAPHREISYYSQLLQKFGGR